MHLSPVYDKRTKPNDDSSSLNNKLLSIKRDETQLWADFKKGDERAFTQLYNDYIVQLFHYGERLTAEKIIIEDSIHDFFVDLWKNRESISQVQSIKFYLYKGFKNRLIKNLEKNRRFSLTTITENYQFEIVFSPEFDLIAQQITQQQKEQLQEAINKLAPRQKEALTLRFYDELSYEEIAALMLLPVKSVYMLIYRSIVFLKQYLDKLKFTLFCFFLFYKSI